MAWTRKISDFAAKTGASTSTGLRSGKPVSHTARARNLLAQSRQYRREAEELATQHGLTDWRMGTASLFHGTETPWAGDRLRSGVGRVYGNALGPGLYTTPKIDRAGVYAYSTGTIYGLRPKRSLQLLNLDKKLPRSIFETMGQQLNDPSWVAQMRNSPGKDVQRSWMLRLMRNSSVEHSEKNILAVHDKMRKHYQGVKTRDTTVLFDPQQHAEVVAKVAGTGTTSSPEAVRARVLYNLSRSKRASAARAFYQGSPPRSAARRQLMEQEARGGFIDDPRRTDPYNFK